MRKSDSTIFLVFLLVLLAIEAALLLGAGGLYIDRHEGDLVHLLEILFRMAGGQRVHQDFLTPIGVLAFTPMTFFLSLGAGVGHAIILGQLLVGLILLPFIWWVGASRLSLSLAIMLGAAVIVLATAVDSGGNITSLNISMHYNRWAWAAAFIVLVAAVIEPEAMRSPFLDGTTIGLGMAFLALSKVTFFVAFAAPVVLALVLRRDGRTLLIALIVGLVGVGLTWAVMGAGFLPAYIDNLLLVRASPLRNYPGQPFSAIVGGSSFVFGNLLALAAVVLLRKAGRSIEAIMLLVLLPAFLYVTYQNYGNDPKWLFLLGLFLFALRPGRDKFGPAGLDVRGALGSVALMALVLISASSINLALSPMRMLEVHAADYEPVLAQPRHADLLTKRHRDTALEIRKPVIVNTTDFPAFAKRDDIKPAIVIAGEARPRCEMKLGLIGTMRAIAADLDRSGITRGRTVFTTDLFDSLFLFGDLKMTPGGAPWYYGGLTGLDAADFVLVPFCPIAYPVESEIAKELAARKGLVLTEVRRTALYVLYRKGGS